MSASLVSASLVYPLLAALLAQAPPEKPRGRDAAESREANLARYRLAAEEGAPPPPALGPLGVRVLYPSGVPQGVTVTGFAEDSPAWDAGLRPGDRVLEVDGSPVGLLRGRYYEPADVLPPGVPGPTELLVQSIGLDGVARHSYVSLTAPGRPAGPPGRRRADESLVRNVARYQPKAVRFDHESIYELGAAVAYTHERGATIVSVKPGGAADRAGLRAGDSILEVDGGPVGKFGRRVYETWPRFGRGDDDTVELLVGTADEDGGVRYFYPEVRLDPRTGPG